MAQVSKLKHCLCLYTYNKERNKGQYRLTRLKSCHLQHANVEMKEKRKFQCLHVYV